MNRRAFFGILTAGLAAAADPERLLWMPGRKLISIPTTAILEAAVSDVHRVALITPSLFAELVLKDLREALQAANSTSTAIRTQRRRKFTGRFGVG